MQLCILLMILNSTIRDTCSVIRPSGCLEKDYAWLRIEDNKAFLAHRGINIIILFFFFVHSLILTFNSGIQHWGKRSDVIRSEFHDVSSSMNVFGRVIVNNSLLLLIC